MAAGKYNISCTLRFDEFIYKFCFVLSWIQNSGKYDFFFAFAFLQKFSVFNSF